MLIYDKKSVSVNFTESQKSWREIRVGVCVSIHNAVNIWTQFSFHAKEATSYASTAVLAYVIMIIVYS